MSISGVNVTLGKVFQDSMGNLKITDGISRDFKKDLSDARNNTKVNMKTESAVDEYKRKHPDDTFNVNRQVNAGKNVLSKNGADEVSRDDMTMDEYKSFITALMNSIPFDASQQNITEIWNISEKGWEQMKNDPDYEAWVLGYTSLNRAVRIPFGLSGSGRLCTENFGASIEQHIGQSVPQGGFESKVKESYWEHRAERKKRMEEQQEKKRIQEEAMKKSDIQRQLMSQWTLEALEVDHSDPGMAKSTGILLTANADYEANFIMADTNLI